MMRVLYSSCSTHHFQGCRGGHDEERDTNVMLYTATDDNMTDNFHNTSND